MSDERLRALARRFRETGAVADEAAWLKARLRTAELDAAQVELAGYLGHPAARASTTRLLPVLRKDCLEFVELLHKEVWGSRESVVRALIASAHHVAVSRAESLLMGVDLAERWCVAAPHDREALETQAEERGLGVEAPGFSLPALAATFAGAVLSNRDAEFGSGPDWPLAAGRSLKCAAAVLHGRTERPLGRVRVPPPLLLAIRHELVPWLLGYGDPVRDRVEARDREE